MPKSQNTAVDLPIGKIDLAKAIKLRFAHGLSYSQIGNHFNVSRQAAFSALDRYKGIFDETGQVAAMRQSSADIYMALESDMVMCLLGNMEKFKKESFYYQTKSLETIHKIRSLEEGRPSQIIESRQVTLTGDLASFVKR